MLSRFIKSTPNKKDETTDGCTRERRPYNLKELEFAVRFSSFQDSPSVYLYRGEGGIEGGGEGNLYVS
jgi:hypothetical protein